MKKEHQDSQYKKDGAEEKNQHGTNGGRKDDGRQPDREKNEDIDYSKLDVDESTGGSAMAEAEAEDDEEV